MIVRPQQPVQAIVPYVRPRANVVEFAAEGVAADVRMTPSGRRGRSSIYSLRLASLHFDVTGRLIGVLPNGEAVELGGLAVAPGSIGSARLAVTPPRGPAYEAVYLEIVSDGMLLRVEAPRPIQKRAPRAFKVAATLFGAGVVAVGAATLAMVIPQKPLIALPDHPIAGTAVRVPYTSRGYGAITYAVTFDDGAPLGGGPLVAPRGDIMLMLPPASAHRRISVALTQHGVLGPVLADASFAVAAPAPAERSTAPARVLSFAVRRDRDPAGETILASYLAVGDQGTIALFDPSGKSIASTRFAHVGTSRLTVGHAYSAVPLVAKIVVQRGASQAVASIALQPNAVLDAAVDEAAQPESVAPVDAFSAQAVNPGIVSVDGRAVAAQPLRLRLMAHASQTHIELQDQSGGTLAETDVAAGLTRATLPLPAAQSVQTYSLVLRYTRNGAEETVLRTVVVGLK